MSPVVSFPNEVPLVESESRIFNVLTLHVPVKYASAIFLLEDSTFNFPPDLLVVTDNIPDSGYDNEPLVLSKAISPSAGRITPVVPPFPSLQ